MLVADAPKRANLEILGCSGSLGDPGNGTSCFLLNNNVLIDAGSGLAALPTSRLCEIDHVLLTHAHLDHFSCLPLLVETRQHFKPKPLKVYGLESTLAVLQAHVFNNVVWPDFSVIPSAAQPAMEYVSLDTTQQLQFSGVAVQAFSVNHSVPTVGYVLRSGTGVLMISSDTYLTEDLSGVLNTSEQIDHLIVESSFANKDLALSRLSMHLCPSLLAEQLKRFGALNKVWVAYLKEWDRELIETELQSIKGGFSLNLMRQGQCLSF